MDNVELTKNMVKWLKEIYLAKAKEHNDFASSYHAVAMGSKTKDSEIFYEEMASEHSEFAHVLECLAKELDLY